MKRKINVKIDIKNIQQQMENTARQEYRKQLTKEIRDGMSSVIHDYISSLIMDKQEQFADIMYKVLKDILRENTKTTQIGMVKQYELITGFFKGEKPNKEVIKNKKGIGGTTQ